MVKAPGWWWALVGAACIATVLGWNLFWYQCDDAYIAFRYVANRQHGLGYVWNPPPFAPVEGYTSFLWVVLLDAIWTVTGVMPPDVATQLDLLFSLAAVGVIADAARRIALPASLDAHRPAVVGAVLLGVVSNTTFLAWTSSGLETALFDLWLLLWAHRVAFSRRGAAWPFTLALLASLATLTRPDGLLWLAATPFVVAADRWVRGWRRADVWGLAPFALPLAHLLWRHATYGFWLPNTYHAKHVAPWPGAGMNYFWLFVIEYAWWLWWPLMLGALWIHRDRLRAWGPWRDHGAAVLAAATFVAHAGYYVFRVGGDHFEYRIFLQWVWIFWLMAPWLWARLHLPPRWALAWTLVALPATAAIPWADWVQMRAVTDKDAIPKLRMPLAHAVPWPVSSYVELHDDIERYLVRHTIRVSHQSHRMFRIQHERNFPTRAESLAMIGPEHWTDAGPPTRYPVVVLGSVGISGWNMPWVGIIDRFGLNDRVIARHPVDPDKPRYMAHDRSPPRGYVRCYRPNIPRPKGTFTLRKRRDPMTAAELADCERIWMDKALSGALGNHDAE